MSNITLKDLNNMFGLFTRIVLTITFVWIYFTPRKTSYIPINSMGEANFELALIIFTWIVFGLVQLTNKKVNRFSYKTYEIYGCDRVEEMKKWE